MERSREEKTKSVSKKQNNLIDDLKLEIASELGIVEQIKDKGWQSLSPRISGKIGGKLSQRLKKMGK
ncbi:MAG: small, acid-soluble spore protein, alpha/beta type [Peptococcaceae bacterium]|nr:small, acid-soluble spore protein, alpha/beta type [Peptococcaceae bacterium]